MDATPTVIREDRGSLIESYAGWARDLAKRFRHSSLEREDIDQIAMLATVHAIDGYEPGHGATLNTFVRRHVEWALGNEMKRARRSVRLMTQLLDDVVDHSQDADPRENECDDLYSAMETLPHADQERLIDHYGLDGYPAMSLPQLGMRGNYSRLTASNRNGAALLKLKAALSV